MQKSMATITIWMICPEYILPTVLIANLPNKQKNSTVFMMVGPAVAVGTLVFFGGYRLPPSCWLDLR